MKNKKALIFLICLITLSVFLTGCKRVDDLKVKMGLRNTDFEYIKQNKVQKIIIQSTRDTGFRFIVTDKRAMNDLYEILSTGKVTNEKTDLEPDYIFEFHEGPDKIHKFSYVAGLQKKGVGNFYSDDKSYMVSKRVDNDIIKNLSNLRKPRAFEELYYNVILNFLEQYGSGIPKDRPVGINISDDLEVAKYILSNDIEDFKINLNAKMSNAKLIEKNKEDFSFIINIKTYGYKTTVYKSIITINDRNDNSEVKYYVWCDYKDKGWNISITKDKPENF